MKKKSKAEIMLRELKDKVFDKIKSAYDHDRHDETMCGAFMRHLGRAVNLSGGEENFNNVRVWDDRPLSNPSYG
jgi:hypothetical protein